MHLTSQADHSPDYSTLSYRDPTGDAAVRNLTPGNISVTWPDGFTVWFTPAESQLLLRFIKWSFSFRMSRKAHVWATKKKAATDSYIRNGSMSENQSR